MMILSNGLTDAADEGFLKVANSLIKRIKKEQPDVFVISYERHTELSDRHFELNKLLLNRSMFRLIRKRNETLLYIPFPARSLATALRIFILSRISRQPISVLLVMKDSMNGLAKTLLRRSGARLLVLSRDAEQFYQTMIPVQRICYLKTGIDTHKFVSVSQERTKALKEKYGFDPDRPVILHVGHLNSGRGIGDLLKLDPSYQVLLVVSTLTKNEQDSELRQQLIQRPNIRIIEEYIPNIQEIYQMCDIYFFPVEESGRCIDAPLSCLEAAACNKPVITTDYGEMREFVGKSGFYYIKNHDAACLNQMIEKVLRDKGHDSRGAVMDYDWDYAVHHLLEMH